MKTLLINENGAQWLDIDNDLDAIEKTLNTNEALNWPYISINGQRFIGICYDRGKLLNLPIAVCKQNATTLFDFHNGPMLIVKPLKLYEGEDITGLESNDIDLLKTRLIPGPNKFKLCGFRFYPTMLVID